VSSKRIRTSRWLALPCAFGLASSSVPTGDAHAEANHIGSLSVIQAPFATAVAFGDKTTGALVGLRSEYFYRPIRYFQFGAGVRYHWYLLDAATYGEFIAAFHLAAVLPLGEKFELTLSPGIGYAYLSAAYDGGGPGPSFGIDLAASYRVNETWAILIQTGATASSTRATSPRYGESNRLALALPLSFGTQILW